MNTLSLALNGRIAASLNVLPEPQKAPLTTLFPQPPTPTLSGRSTPSLSPLNRRQSSNGWYNTQNNLTLDDFARRLETKLSRFEQWQTRCAQNILMALMTPTPVVLFVFNPIGVLVWVVVVVWWLLGRSGGV